MNYIGPGLGVATETEDENFVFSIENGDDWFYFEDEYSSSLRSEMTSSGSYPFHISSISGSETEVLRMTYKKQPRHTVLHKGACAFNGIDTSASHDTSQTTSGHSGLTVQVNVEDL